MMTKLLQRHTECPVEGLMSTPASHKWDGIIETGGVCIMHTAQRAALPAQIQEQRPVETL